MILFQNFSFCTEVDDVTKFCTWACVAVLACGLTIWADTASDELQKWQGAWQQRTATIDGNAIPAADVAKVKFTVVGDKYTITTGDVVQSEGTIKLDLTKNPKTVDFTETKGPNQGKSFLGIYTLTGATLKYCFGESGKERPTKFVSNQGYSLMTFVK